MNAVGPIEVRVDSRVLTFMPGAVVTMGRDPASAIAVDNHNVSRRHARLEVIDGAWTLVDLASTQGTYVDGERVDRKALHGPTMAWLGMAPAGVEIRCGPTVLVDDDATVRSFVPPPAATATVLPPPPAAYAPPVPALSSAAAPVDGTRAPPATDAICLLVGGVLAVIGSFLPWAKLTAVLVGTISVSGVDGGDGYIAIALAVPLLIFGARKLSASRARIPVVWAIVLATSLLVLSFFEMGNVSDHVKRANSEVRNYGHATVGVGLWLLLAGGIVATVGSVMARSRQRTARPPA